ncbi:MAG TPA: DUF4334 domain-containing protein, partial [Mycolicibacterium fallax]|nr:DUF4334 domain-containing protein [Mycolicibacterium fallax]
IHRGLTGNGVAESCPFVVGAEGQPKPTMRRSDFRQIYDQLPIMDVFRRLDPGAADTPVQAVLGAMDARGSRRPYFFVLRRDDSLPVR